MKTKNHLSLLVINLLLLGVMFLIPVEKSQAQILELDQKIFGMDCAPCAKGVENRMKRMDGVQSAVLDLNKGEANLLFIEQHTTSLKQIQESIMDGGFSPKDARIKVRGKVQNVDGEWQLTTESGDLFVFDDTDASAVELIDGKTTTIEGIVAESDGQERWVLTINQPQDAG